ncbi:hypothetical protein GCM10010331_70640 [Streptomyces xanthochromogenes]|nr:hypothetical protein [Streptomyces xanthochromogenes]GHB72380.1 hypothetical protein GCM10010331_70640 [Streptomyces xanthochromogenes]
MDNFVLDEAIVSQFSSLLHDEGVMRGGIQNVCMYAGIQNVCRHEEPQA